MTFSGNVNNEPEKSLLHYGDASDSRSSLTFDCLKIKSKGHRSYQALYTHFIYTVHKLRLLAIHFGCEQNLQNNQ